MIRPGDATLHFLCGKIAAGRSHWRASSRDATLRSCSAMIRASTYLAPVGRYIATGVVIERKPFPLISALRFSSAAAVAQDDRTVCLESLRAAKEHVLRAVRISQSASMHAKSQAWHLPAFNTGKTCSR
jgi:hypothetical protein